MKRISFFHWLSAKSLQNLKYFCMENDTKYYKLNNYKKTTLPFLYFLKSNYGCKFLPLFSLLPSPLCLLEKWKKINLQSILFFNLRLQVLTYSVDNIPLPFLSLLYYPNKENIFSYALTSFSLPSPSLPFLTNLVSDHNASLNFHK